MSGRDIVGLIRWGGGDSSVLIKIRGTLGSECSLEELRAELEKLLRDCGLTVSSFSVTKPPKKGKSKKKK